jgi:hypothetical protein
MNEIYEIYVLEGSQGQYSDYRAWVEAVFTDVEHAITYCDNTWKDVELKYIALDGNYWSPDVIFSIDVELADDYEPRHYNLSRYTINPKKGAVEREY